MFIYFLTFSIVVYLALLGDSCLRNVAVSKCNLIRTPRDAFISKIYLTLSCLILIALSSLREGVGDDYDHIYVVGFNKIYYDEIPNWEMTFTYFIKLLQTISKDYHFIFFVCSCITIGFTYRAILRQVSLRSIGIFTLCFGGFYFFSFNGIRQAIAIALFLNALEHVARREPLQYCLWIVAASVFHKSAIALLFIYPVLVLGKRGALLLLVGSLCACLVLSNTGMVRTIAGLISEKYASYIDSEMYVYAGDIDIRDLVICTFPLLLSLFYSVRCGGEISMEIRHDLWPYLLCCAIGVSLSLLSGFVFLLSRFAVYFEGAVILTVPKLIEEFKSQRRTEAKLVVAVALFLFTIVVFGIRNQDLIQPYRSVFSALPIE